jgi:hypothetical protein
MKLPTLFYFIDLRLDMCYLKAVRDLGYTPETMRIVPVVSQADIYSLRADGDSRAWIEDYLHGGTVPTKEGEAYRKGEEEVRIVQAGSYTTEFCAPPPVYSIAVMDGVASSDISALANFSELWVCDGRAREMLTFLGVTVPIEVVRPESLEKSFDPFSLV